MKSSPPKKPGKSPGPAQKQQAGGERPSGQQQQAASGAGGEHGEGNYAATRQYNEGVKKHMEGHDIEKEARDAAPRTASEEADLLAAEREGKSRARGGDGSRGEESIREDEEK